MDKRTSLMLLISGVLIVALLFAGYYKVEMAQKNNIIAQIEPDKSCDLQKTACTLKLPGGGKVTLDIQPKPIPLVQNIDITINTEVLKAEAVTVDFKGTTMNMGPNNVTLKASTPELYSGKGMLPVCIRNSMEWQADVYLQTSEGIIVAPFIFVTRKH
ncbi:MAG: hypothetical protein KZQ70_08145 [gamma proteobacterium symbiont of Lucinoma myriamae]|nr:hypothetical protein [gamma proteobacterium symbiont of Lucinoma myriamae]MCU7819109.1 hypothetical protein [gamma proteobacterium symbiont of Lucinoma myriamae]MCU7832504.1 hypothetical protein [gamma proteobacterium symbiont of Lucinoma myriamae]